MARKKGKENSNSVNMFDTLSDEDLSHQLLFNDEKEITKMLSIMKENEVTPVGLEDVILEIKNRQAIVKNKKLSYNT